MSPGGTMLRVYEALKAQDIAGHFAPGERLDPAQLAPHLAASATPVRDALHRLTGERLVDSLLHGGFRQPQISEAALRDLYAWSRDLFHLIVQSVGQQRPATLAGDRKVAGTSGADMPDMATAFRRVAQLSPVREHLVQVSSLNDRLALYRLPETAVVPSMGDEVRALHDAIDAKAWREVIQVFDRMNRRHVRAVPDIIAMLLRERGERS